MKWLVLIGIGLIGGMGGPLTKSKQEK